MTDLLVTDALSHRAQAADHVQVVGPNEVDPTIVGSDDQVLGAAHGGADPVAGDRAAYTYLPESVERFASPPGLADAMRRAGLRDVRYRRFGFGTIALHVGVA